MMLEKMILVSIPYRQTINHQKKNMSVKETIEVSIPYRQTINNNTNLYDLAEDICFNSLQVDYKLASLLRTYRNLLDVSIPYRQTINFSFSQDEANSKKGFNSLQVDYKLPPTLSILFLFPCFNSLQVDYKRIDKSICWYCLLQVSIPYRQTIN